MSKFGGSTKLGGGALFGGGPSLYEAWIGTIWDLMGRGVFDRARGDTTKNITKLLSVIAGQFSGAEVDALRIRSEGLAGKAIEALDDWASIYQVKWSSANDDALRALLTALMANEANITSSTRTASVVSSIQDAASSGIASSSTMYQCTMSQCTGVDNSGDGCRCVGVRVPAWFWRTEFRPWFRAAQEWCDRSDPYYGETSLCVTNSSGEPYFVLGTSIVDRDVVRD